MPTSTTSGRVGATLLGLDGRDLLRAGAVGVLVVDLDAVLLGEVLHDGAVVGPTRQRNGDHVDVTLLLRGLDQRATSRRLPCAEVTVDQLTDLGRCVRSAATESVVNVVPTSPAAKAILSLFEITPKAS